MLFLEQGAPADARLAFPSECGTGWCRGVPEAVARLTDSLRALTHVLALIVICLLIRV